MNYVYIIRYKHSEKLYIGATNDLRRRLKEHCRKGNLELLYYEAYKASDDAWRREHNLKYFGKAYGQLKGRMKKSLQ